MDSVRKQLFDHQELITERLLATPLPQQSLGPYRVPGRWMPFLKCWGDTPHDPEAQYTVTSYQCSSEEDLYLSSDHRTGAVTMEVKDAVLWHAGRRHRVAPFRIATEARRALRDIRAIGDASTTGSWSGYCLAKSGRLPVGADTPAMLTGPLATRQH